MKLAALVLVLATSIDCFTPPFLFNEVHITGYTSKSSDFPFPRIVNGKVVKPHSIPYQVYMRVSKGENITACGGSLITQKFVLTAAHCIIRATSIVVKLGVHDIKVNNTQQVTVTAEKWSYHLKYGNRWHNDIGIIELPEKIILNDAIALARLPSPSDDFDLVGKTARVSGWGRKSGNGKTSRKLRAINTTVISVEECEKRYSGLIDSQFCLGAEGGRTACQGDSGGPVVVEDTVVGLVSYGTNNCLKLPSVMTKVSSFLEWIEKNTDWVPK